MGGKSPRSIAGYEPGAQSATLLSTPAVPVSHFLRMKRGFTLPVLETLDVKLVRFV